MQGRCRCDSWTLADLGSHWFLQVIEYELRSRLLMETVIDLVLIVILAR